MIAHDPGRTSASHLVLLQHCSYSGRDDVRHPPATSSDAADNGTARHAVYAELAAGREPTKEMLELADIGESHVSAVRDWLTDELVDVPLERRIVERAFAWDPATDTGRELATNGHRDYSDARPGERPGTVDLAWVEGGVLHLRDWKCGLRSRVDPAAENMQLRALALYVCRALHLEAATVGPLFVDDEGEVSDRDVATLDDFDLAAVAGEVREIIRRIPDSQPVIGDWCAENYCALNGICPAHVEVWSRFIRAVPGAPTFMPGESLPVPQTPAHAALLVDLLPVVEAALEASKLGLRAWTDEHGLIATRDGKWWGKKIVEKRAIAPTPEAIEALKAHGVERAVETKTTTTITVGAVEKACKAITKRGKGAAKIKEVFDALGTAVVTSAYPQYTYVKVNEDQKEAEAAE